MKHPLPARATFAGILLALALVVSITPARAAEPRAPAPTAAAVTERVAKIQSALQAAGIDGWLFYDFRGINPIANRILLMPGGGIASRRWLYFVPATGAPVAIVHAIEPHRLDHLPGAKTVYSAWPTLQAAIRTALAGKKKVAMEYSPDGGIPYLARVDAGTVEFVRSTGSEVVTSGGLLEQFEAVWSPAQRAQHDRAAAAAAAAQWRLQDTGGGAADATARWSRARQRRCGRRLRCRGGRRRRRSASSRDCCRVRSGDPSLEPRAPRVSRNR